MRKKIIGYWLPAAGCFCQKRKGFTLIELLVTITLIGFIMTVTTGMLLGVFKSKRKTESISAVKQSGDYALEIVSSMIRAAKSVDSAEGSALTITNQNDESIVFTCSNGNPGTINYRVAAGSPNYLVSSTAGFDVSGCSFIRTIGGVMVPDKVAISFTLTKGAGTTDQAQSTFKTTVSLRSY